MNGAQHQAALLERQRLATPEHRSREHRRRELETCCQFFIGYAAKYDMPVCGACKGGLSR